MFDENHDPKNDADFTRFSGLMDEIATGLGKNVHKNRIAGYYKEIGYFNLDEFEKCYKPLKNGEISYNFPSIAQMKAVYHDHMREVVSDKKAAEIKKESEEMEKLSPFGTRWGLRILTCHASDLVKWQHDKAYELCQFACMLSRQIDKGMIDETEALKTLVEEGKNYEVNIDKVWVKFKTKSAIKNREPVLADYLAV